MVDITISIPEELESIYKVYRRCGQYFGWVRKNEMLDSMSKGYMYTIYIDDEIHGFCRFNHQRAGGVVIYEICLDEECRGKGIGRKIINKLPKPIKAKCPTNFESNNFYQHLGFILQGQEYTKKGTPLNIWYLRNKGQKKLF